ncbi:hypothetical protein DN398_17765 [Bacillus sp. JAS102]|nr:hypothetical protein DN398_17765 [Bacillus sp. JAS102]
MNNFRECIVDRNKRWSMERVILHKIYPTLMGSKTPTSKFSESKEVRWGAGCPLKYEENPH